VPDILFWVLTLGVGRVGIVAIMKVDVNRKITARHHKLEVAELSPRP
jgi:hypothetical protein